MATAVQMPTPSAAEAARESVERFIETAQRMSLLRFITCGSVDDGKSTLIGRLLYDSKQLLDDQLAALQHDSGGAGETPDTLDFASLVDGLAAEREQGITIDVAYRFFATPRRKFIVADTPGHEQYTRNMVTGASTADLAVILIDARKGVLPQTRRHAQLVHLLGIGKLVLAVNKMDLVGNDAAVFDRIVADFRAFADGAGIGAVMAIPLSGRNGDNVTRPSAAMPWYTGPSLLEHLETVEVGARAVGGPLRMAVQWVNRPNQDFRGYAGTIASGRVAVGDAVAVLPSGRRSTVTRILTPAGERDVAAAGEAITLTLADEIDISRGDLLVDAQAVPAMADRLAATLIWMGDAPLTRGSYWLKIGTRTVSARLSELGDVLDIATMDRRPASTLALNDIGEAALELDRAVPAIRYADSRELGGFILIDKASNATVAAGLVRDFPVAAHPHAARTQGEILWIDAPTPAARDAQARAMRSQLAAAGRASLILDETEMAALDADLAPEASEERLRRLRALATLVSDQGIDVIIAADVPEAAAQPGRHIGPADTATALEWVI